MTISHVRAGAGETLWIGGDTYTFKAAGGTTSGAFGLLEASIPPGSGPPSHVHGNEDEAFYVLAGSLAVTAGDDTYEARAGDFIYLPRGTPHHFVNPNADAARALILYTPAGLEDYLGKIGRPAVPGQPAPLPAAEDIEQAVRFAPEHGLRIILPAGGPPPDPAAAARETTRRVFRTIDSRDATAIAALFTEDAVAVFGNQPPMVGRAAIAAGTESFFASVAGLRHEITAEWHTDADTMAEAAVTYVRHDGGTVTLPAFSTWHTTPAGAIDRYHVYFDPTPIYA